MSTTFAALANQQYRWLLSANVAQFFAISARMMMCNLLAWQLTGEEISLAFINVSLAIPMFIGALIAGAFVDRFERRRLISLGLLVVLIGEASILLALLFDQLTFIQLLLVTFITGCAHPFIYPASVAMMYQILGRDLVANGVALLSSGMNLSRILGPSITGVLLAWLSASVAYGMVAALFVLALLCHCQLEKDQPPGAELSGVFSEIRSGLRYLIDDRSIALCLLFSMPPLMLLMSVQYMLVIFANEVWQVGEAGLGVLLTAMGLGSFLGALAVARIGASMSRLKLMLVFALVSALCFALFSQSPWFIPALALLVCANASAAISLVTNQVIVQLLVKDHARGRVSGYILMTYSLAPLALFPISMLADAVGVNNAVSSAALVVILAVILLVLVSKKLRGIDDVLRTKAEREAL